MQDLRIVHARRRLDWLLLRAATRHAEADMVEVDPALTPSERRVQARHHREAADRYNAAWRRASNVARSSARQRRYAWLAPLRKALARLRPSRLFTTGAAQPVPEDIQ